MLLLCLHVGGNGLGKLPVLVCNMQVAFLFSWSELAGEWLG